MERPNAMQNIRIGFDESSVPVAVKCSRFERWPSWKMNTIAPNVADRDRTFITSAFSGITTLPVIRNSTTNVTRAMIPAAMGTQLKMAVLESTSSADGPATSTGNGACRPRMSWTRRSPAGETGSTDGITENQAAFGEENRPDDRFAGNTLRPPA